MELSVLDLLERMFVIVCGRAHRCKVPITNTRVLVGKITLVVSFPKTHIPIVHGYLGDATGTLP